MSQAQLRTERDFFRSRVPAGRIEGLAPTAAGNLSSIRTVVFDLHRHDHLHRALRVDGELIPVLAFPMAHQNLVHMATSKPQSRVSPDGVVEILLARRTFDKLADHYGVSRFGSLELQPEAAVGDVALRHLGACLDCALEHPDGPDVDTIDGIVEALTLHIAQRYGGLYPPRWSRGGLAPWQLRLARNALEGHLDDSVSLEELARQCGLSTSHVSRAFARSTRFAPRRWLMRRRIELA